VTRARTRRPVRAIVLALAIPLAGGCGSATSSPASPIVASHEPGPPGLDWATADVERPAGMDATPPSIPPVGAGGGLGHPGHFSSQGNPYDVAAIGDRLVAVGYTFPDFVPVTWTAAQPDRHRWTLAGLPTTNADGTFAMSIAAGLASGPTRDRVAVVGHAGNDATAWTSTDGAAWETAAGGDAFIEAPGTGMTTVVARPKGFVAGGFAGALNQPGAPRFWSSPDGRSWTRLSSADAGAAGRIASIAAGPAGYVAVGTVGPVGHATTSAVWTSADGVRWQRVADSPELAAGEMASVAAGGPGWVAVGSDLASKAAVVWLSADGRTWRRAPAQESLTYHGLGITMADVVGGPDGRLVAVGHFLFGQQFGQGTAWTSDDGGTTWTRMPDQASFGQGEPQAVIPDGPGYVATGTVGAPDNYIPTVWLSPSDR
jgi:hypothetical protein